MYKPPENSNRVKSIKSKFENIENQKLNNIPLIKRNGTRCDLSNFSKSKTEFIRINSAKQDLSRQLSDPAKRNIKRTPAFRIDKNIDKNSLFQRNAQYNRSCHFNKVDDSKNSALKTNCDSNRNIINTTELYKDKSHVPKLFDKPILLKSKSSHDFAYIRSKFDRKQNTKNLENQRNNDTSNSTTLEKIVSLYTEPVPKSLRIKPSANTHNVETLKICDVTKPEKIQMALSDTLKAALKRPLPKGPAPIKPPRTFEHGFKKEVVKNTSFLHDQRKEDEVKPSVTLHKHDPRYMLNKLENALRNNKIRKQLKQETSTTSGEDSDDSVLFKSKTHRELPSIPSLPTNPSNLLNFNCFNGLSLCKSTYETIHEPKSAFFVSCKEEPVYDEPFCFGRGSDNNSFTGGYDNDKKSLYYLSTPLLGDDGRTGGKNMDENLIRSEDGGVLQNQHDIHRKQMSTETSSLSSFTSDLDSAASTPLEEKEVFDTSPKIKQLINTFENKQISNLTKKEHYSHAPVDGPHQIDDLKMPLQKTLERRLEDETRGETQQKERKTSVDKIINKFQSYVKTMPKYQKSKLHKDDCLFYCCLIVGWDTEKPQIKFKFPRNVTIPDRIEDLCYPEATSGPLDVSNNAQCYSLVITNDKGERTFGYCRRVIPEGSTKCIPLAYCILSKYRAPRFYKKILMELESRHGIPDKLRDELISGFYNNKFPRPGESIKINLTNVVRDLNALTRHHQINKQEGCSDLVDSLDLTSFVHVDTTRGYGSLNKVKKTSDSFEFVIINDSEVDDKHCSSGPSIIIENNGRTELILALHHDTRYEEADLKPLHKLPPDILLKIFASLLLERKVILISCVISKLSCCVDALQSILYPFSWPHTFIPILPQCLWDIVESPTPVICGILSVSVVNEHKIEHGIVVDLDEGNILCEEGDENSILSDSMKKAWFQGLALANTVLPENYVHSVYLSDAYVKVFTASLKHYKTHIINGSFEKEAFIAKGKTKGIRRFLKWFTETTMFVSFIDTVLTNPDSFKTFDKKIEMYGSDESKMILSKLIEWKK